MKFPDINFDLSFNSATIGGIDEAGRGPWAGPVVSAIVLIERSTKVISGINDSKKLSSKKREYIFNIITKEMEYAVGMIDVDIIDEIGVGKATKLSMKAAFDNLDRKPNLVLIDGRDKIDISSDMLNIIKGDTKSISIAAASIIAKVTRDEIMRNFAIKHPEYFWHKNVGYGTKKHIEAINIYGITKIHRKSFRPIKKYIETGSIT